MKYCKILSEDWCDFLFVCLFVLFFVVVDVKKVCVCFCGFLCFSDIKKLGIVFFCLFLFLFVNKTPPY